jgi:hypothetical protein
MVGKHSQKIKREDIPQPWGSNPLIPMGNLAAPRLPTNPGRDLLNQAAPNLESTVPQPRV